MSDDAARDDAGALDHDRVSRVTRRALEWARGDDYAGWDPYDGLNSPLLSALGVNWLTRLVGIHAVLRSPVNLRPLLGVPRERNPKGVALFARSYLNLYEHTGNEAYLDEADALLDWLAHNESSAFDPACWGYNFDWQNGRKFFLPANHPSTVVSVFCGRAFLHRWRVGGDADHLRRAEGVCEFLTTAVNTCRYEGHEVYAYTPDDSFVVVNSNALVAAFLAEVGDAAGRDAFLERADELVAFLLDAQASTGAWYYAMPPEESHLTHDNFHTGYVLESLLDYLGVRPDDERVEAAYREGLRFYRESLFDPDGAPWFDHETPYPRDVHSAAQGIRTFVRDGGDRELHRARTVVEWSLSNLYDPAGYFYRYRGRLYDDTTPYIRWGQAWMCFALSSYLRYADRPTASTPDRVH
ncbi:MAG: hypothetical protein ABEJ61_01450 [Haloferacaceae archaeon]